MAKFKNPPVVEVWISFAFDPNEKKREWDLSLVGEYVQQYSKEFPKLQVMHEQQIQVQETSATQLPKVVGREQKVRAARIFNEDQSRVLQIRDDLISYHVVKTDNGYPGYATARDEAIEKLKDYLRLFQPARIRNAALHYVDVIEIPRPPGGKIDVDDYFVASADLPEEPFGIIADLSVQFIIACPVDDGPLILRLDTLPPTEDQETHRFLMNWHKESTGVDSLDLSEVRRRLDLSHEYLTQCFLQSLRQRTIDLFGPIKED